jgi:hypothetical protein
MEKTKLPKEYRSYNISFSYQPERAKYRSNKAFTVVCDTAQEAMDFINLYFSDVEFHNINRNAKDIVVPSKFLQDKFSTTNEVI